MSAAVCQQGGCGVLAVGRCTICGRALCRQHSLLGDRCWPCTERKSVDDAVAKADLEVLAAQADAEREQFLLTIPDPIERRVVAYGRFANITMSWVGTPEVVLSGPRVRALVDGPDAPDVTEWFIEQARRCGIAPTRHRFMSRRTNWLGKVKHEFEEVDAYPLMWIAAAGHEPSAQMYILVDGRRADAVRFLPKNQGSGPAGMALVAIAELLGLDAPDS